MHLDEDLLRERLRHPIHTLSKRRLMVQVSSKDALEDRGRTAPSLNAGLDRLGHYENVQDTSGNT
jgi:hypothetical protein